MNDQVAIVAVFYITLKKQQSSSSPTWQKYLNKLSQSLAPVKQTTTRPHRNNKNLLRPFHIDHTQENSFSGSILLSYNTLSMYISKPYLPWRVPLLFSLLSSMFEHWRIPSHLVLSMPAFLLFNPADNYPMHCIREKYFCAKIQVFSFCFYYSLSLHKICNYYTMASQHFKNFQHLHFCLFFPYLTWVSTNIKK